MSEPSTWAMEQARRLYLYGVCKCDHNGACDLHTDIARELDAAREEGRRERDDLDQRNAAMLADLTDAVYGKGTAEAKGYPRGMVAKVRRVFGRLRRIKREESRRSQRFFIADLDALLKEVK